MWHPRSPNARDRGRPHLWFGNIPGSGPPAKSFKKLLERRENLLDDETRKRINGTRDFQAFYRSLGKSDKRDHVVSFLDDSTPCSNGVVNVNIESGRISDRGDIGADSSQ